MNIADTSQSIAIVMDGKGIDSHNNVSLASHSDRDAWNAFVHSQLSAEVYHLFDWRMLFERVFRNPCHYLISRRKDGAVSGVLPLVEMKSMLFGHYLVSVPCFNYCGTLASASGAQMALVAAADRLANKLGAAHVEFRQSASRIAGMRSRTDKVAMRMQLPATIDDLWDDFSSKLRAQIRRPTKDGAVCKAGGSDLVADFYRVFAENMRDLGTPVYSIDLFYEIIRLFPDKTRVFVTYMKGRPVAAGFTIEFRNRLEIPFASSLRAFNRSAVNMLMYWSVLKYAVERGVTLFDFGRSSVDSGTYRFKRQWGAEPHELYWQYLLIERDELPNISPANPRYDVLRTAWRSLPVWATRIIGPGIVRNLP